jgi:hypothetical protein
MMRSWTWIARYALVLLAALLLGAALAELSVFKQTTLGTPSSRRPRPLDSSATAVH